MSQHFDVIIAGAGIVGLAAAYQLMQLQTCSKLLLLEKESEVGMHQTSHNSGVVHTGVYYKSGSLKAKNCIAGRKELLAFCDERGIPYQKMHKLIVATKPEDSLRLRELLQRAQENGIPGAKILSQDAVKELEPNVEAQEALFLPECHIVDYKQVAQSLSSWIANQGGEIIYNEKVERIQQDGNLCAVSTQRKTYHARAFLSCTGLFSDRLAKNSLQADQRIIPFRGEYYEIQPKKRNIVRGLIYPVPDPRFPFLGVHLTPMINGKLEAGPNAVLALSREGYKKFDFNWKDTKDVLSYAGFWRMAWNYWSSGCYELARSMSKRLFLSDLQKMIPCIEEKDLLPGGAGVRAQVVTREGKLLDDFSILQQKNMIYMLNAPSPAATASFSIGRTLAEMILKENSK